MTVDGHSVFSHPLSKRFLKGFVHLHPLVQHPAQTWDLNCLTWQHFEPAATCDLRLFSLKTALLLAVMSALKVSEQAALCAQAPYLIFLPHSVTFSTDLSFLLKVDSEFHPHSDIVLPDFFPVRNGMTDSHPRCQEDFEILYRMQFSNRDLHLFVSYSTRTLGKPNISKWIVELMKICYDLAIMPLLTPVSVHSAMAMVASMKFLKGLSLQDICDAAPWKTLTMFIRHHA